uniref:Putative DNA polymerase n=1 Tax=viral metagenome TaxID=1070528 RepID=A0A6H1ZPQ0_9ZZZZ
MKPELELFIKDRKTFVPPEGPLECKLATIAEQPGRQEVSRYPRRPLIGPAGLLYDGCLQSARLNRSEIYHTNVIKDLDLPLSSYLSTPSRKGDVPRFTTLGQNYIDILKDELSKCTANCFLAMGNVALFALTSRWGITKWRGIPIESTLLPGRKVIPIIHTASFTDEKLFKNPKAWLNKHLITMDMHLARKESEFPDIIRVPRTILIKPSFREVVEYLEMCKLAGLADTIVDYDIETPNMKLGSISFAISPHEAMSIPFTAPGGDYFTPDQEADIMLFIQKILENPDIIKRGQYIIFDSHFLLREYGIRTVNMHDTMVAQKILYPEYNVGLDFIAAMWTDISYYKDDGKFWLGGAGTFEQGWIYNAYDSIVCADAGPKQMQELTEKGNIEAYERQRKVIPPLTYMMEHGIRVDIEGMKKEYDETGPIIEELTEEFQREVGMPMNPMSPQQLANYFYVHKGLPAYKEKGKVTTNEKAMVRIARQGYKSAGLVLKIRRLIKRRSTYLSLDKIDPDNRIRCAYNPVGTRYSRVSSGENIFGTGTNLQNWPHDLLRYLLPDKGYIYCSFDESQFENRIVAYVGNILPMIEAFEAGKDVHSLTGALISGKSYELVKEEDKLGITAPIGDGKHTWRFWGKKCNHALNYDEGYKRFSLDLEIPERDGKVLHYSYHRAYPGVRNSYHASVKAQLAKDRTLTNLLGRRVTFLGQWGDKLFKEAYSCIPQGTCGDVINERGVNHIYYNQDHYRPIELLDQVHDSVGFQVPLALPMVEIAAMFIRIKRNLEQPLRWKDREFIVPVDLTLGFSMYKAECEEIKSKDFPMEPIKLAETLKERIENLRAKTP